MAAPTLIDYAESTWTDPSVTTETTDDLNWDSAGDVVVVLGATEDNGLAMATPTGTGLTLGALSGLPTNTGSSCKVYGWSATAAGDGNTALTSTNGASGARGIAAWSWSGSSGLGTPVVNVGSGITVSVTVAADSSVVMVLADWSATTDVTVDTTPAGGTIRQANVVSGLATFLVVQWDAQAAGTRSYGVSNWTGTGTVSKAAVEVLGAGGSALTATVDDSAGLVDTRALAQTASPTDSAGLTDSAAVAAGHARAATDNAALTDTTSVASAFSRTVTDSAGLTDAATPTLFSLITRTVTDDAGLTDTGDPIALDVAETVTDTAGLTDSATPVLTPTGSNFTRTVDDPAGLVDTAAAASVFTRAQTDPAGTADSVAAATAHARTQTDGAGATDSVTPQLAGAGTRQVDDSAGLTDAVSYSSTQTLTDVLGLIDTAASVLAAARAATDVLGLTDAVTAVVTRSVTVTDSAGLTDSATPALSFGTAHVRTVTDSIGLTSAHRVKRTTHRPDSGMTVRPYSGVTPRYALVPD